MEEYIYLVDGKEVKEVRGGEEVIHVAYGVPETVDVSKIWKCKGKLLQSSGREGQEEKRASRRRDLCLSFALCRLLRLRFAADHIGNVSLPF